jgi:hypothetical protein
MLTVCYSVKGGQGCTTVAAGLALAGRPVMVVDTAGDVPAVLGVPEPTGLGVLDVLSSRRPVRVEALRAVAVDAGPAGVVPRGGSPTGSVPGERWRELAEVLVGDDAVWVLDAGTGPAWRAAVVSGVRVLLVIRNCYLALRRAVQAPVRPSAVVLVEEPGRALGSRDVGAVLAGVPLITVAGDPAVTRAINAGLLVAPPRAWAEAWPGSACRTGLASAPAGADRARGGRGRLVGVPWPPCGRVPWSAWGGVPCGPPARRRVKPLR